MVNNYHIWFLSDVFETYVFKRLKKSGFVKQNFIKRKNMVNTLIERLEQLITPKKMPENLVLRIKELAKPQYFDEGSFVLERGRVCKGAHFLIKGLARSYYEREGKHIISRLMEEGFIITSWLSFYKQQPAQEFIVAMEDCSTLFLRYEDINNLYDEFPVFNEIGRKQVEYSFYASEIRSQMLRGLSAEERYLLFCEKHPTLMARVPLKYIASYLGMTDVTLSRIRANFKKRKV